MKHRNAVRVGNGFMGLGMLLMVAGIAYSVANQLPELNLPGSLYYVELLAIFVGAILWLAGARISGREAVADRYWWLKHFDKRCCRERHRNP
ncbi:stress-induced protein YchH [Dickeya chrysanthemi]|uniref:Stress-induced protein YchH n=1 Tax=Dickeya chrysanthemi TaxID=556 RepID=A0ABU8JP84_DICCH|nr:stress-induced protein YchH [Dickeya chrysanthemi]MBX9447297.1 stress-induced protein YchH [Dickeya chrysanthemi]MCA7006167.1 stress-induced protein YchH [Dickeya chrysanthemi]